jgi:hypothetical protein
LPDDSASGGRGSPGSRQYVFVDNLADKLGLTQGQIVRAWVTDPLPDHDEKIFINLKGQKTVAKTRLDVDRGDELIVQVKSTSPPINLELFRAESARDELDDEALERFLQDQDFSPDEELLDVARFLIDEHLPLTQRTIEDSQEVWDRLHDGEGQLMEERARALKFLFDNDLPVHPELVTTLDHLPEETVSAVDWQVIEGQFSTELSMDSVDFLELIRGIGIDLVRQIGKWPNQASGTVHAELLRRIRDNGTERERGLLSQVLALALASVHPDTFWGIVPLTEGGKPRVFLINFRRERLDGGWRWEIRGWTDLSRTGPVSINLVVSPDRADLTFVFDREEMVTKARQKKDDLAKNLKAIGLEVNMSVKHGEPEPLSPFTTRFRPEISGDPGKVDFTA